MAFFMIEYTKKSYNLSTSSFLIKFDFELKLKFDFWFTIANYENKFFSSRN